MAGNAERSRTIGEQVRQIRESRDQPLRVIAGLAGMSTTTLWRIEQGQHAVTLSELEVLANALKIAPSELTRLPVPAPANGHTDATTQAVRLTLDAVENEQPGGLVLPVAVLAEQVARIQGWRRACRFAEVATELPGLIRNLHTTLATGAEHGELLELAVYLHAQVTRLWLVHAGAPTDLVRRAAFLAQRLARERDELTTLAMAGSGVVETLLFDGGFQLGRAKLNSITQPPTTAQTAGLVGWITAQHATAAVLDGHPGDAAAPMDAAAEIADRFGAAGEVDSLGFLFGPVMAGCFRMYNALEANEPDRVISIAEHVRPEHDPFVANQVFYWVDYGRGLAQLRDRRDDAVRALRTAEDIFPTKVRRDPIVREVIATLLPDTRRNAIGMELRGMAYRVGLPV